MKKIILFILVSASLFADAKIYMGLGYSLYNESYSLAEGTISDTSDNALRVKLGYGIREAYAVEFAFDYIDHASYAQSPATGKAKYGFNIALMKAFDYDIYINPFIKAGFGAGIANDIVITNSNVTSLTYGSFDVGAGFFIPINEHSDFEISYEYKYLSYQPIDELDTTIPNTSHVNTLYFGYNVRF